MTGIERLRDVAHVWNNGELRSIADQIEREHACDMDTIENVRLIVGGVLDEMERHVSGVEGAGDSPVSRWARELREALGGGEHDHAKDVSMSAYDLLPQEDREAIAWVREHGGLEEVEAHWSGRVPLKSVKWMIETHRAKRERLKAHALGLERKCAECGETIRELSGKAAKQSDEIRVMRDVIAETCARLGVEGTGSTVDDAQVIWREISRRLMPEGMEWPRFESGEPVRFGDVVSDGDETGRVYYVTFDTVNPVIIGFTDETPDQDPGTWLEVSVNDGERVKRPVVDSWERLEEDATKNYVDYWGCGRFTCSECPAVVDGKRPWERFGCGDYPEASKNCTVAKARDIVRRAKALAGGA